MKSVAIVGSGISALSTAYNLSKHKVPCTLVTGPKIGGWIESQTHVYSNSNFIFECGPRSLRPMGMSGHATLELVAQLGLQNKVIAIGKNSPAARNRFIYHCNQLQKLPSSPIDLVLSTNTAIKGFLPALITEVFKPKSKNNDETLSEFFGRRFSDKLVQNMISAVIHGIYAGSTNQLSIKSTFPSIWNLEQKYGSITMGMILSMLDNNQYQPKTEEGKRFITEMKEKKIYSFEGGLQTLVNELLNQIRESGTNIIEESCHIVRMGDKVELQLDNQVIEADAVVGAVPAHVMSKLLGNQVPNVSNDLNSISTVDVCVINLLYTGSLLKDPGFGYLVPISEKHNSDLLGVIYDSTTFPEHLNNLNGQYTSLTAMMGGHLFKEKFGTPSTVDKKLMLNKAVIEIEKVLGIPRDKLVTSLVNVHEKCIPQYGVGHDQLILGVKEALRDNNVYLAGASYDGVSVNDCVFAGSKLADTIASRFKSRL